MSGRHGWSAPSRGCSQQSGRLQCAEGRRLLWNVQLPPPYVLRIALSLRETGPGLLRHQHNKWTATCCESNGDAAELTTSVSGFEMIAAMISQLVSTIKLDHLSRDTSHARRHLRKSPPTSRMMYATKQGVGCHDAAELQRKEGQAVGRRQGNGSCHRRALFVCIMTTHCMVYKRTMGGWEDECDLCMLEVDGSFFVCAVVSQDRQHHYRTSSA